jgi:hypothetical protein
LADPSVTLGSSDGIAIDQPQVAIEVLDPSAGNANLGPTDSAMPFILDTGAQAILVVSTAVDEMVANGYRTLGQYDEVGVGGGTHTYDVSLPYTLNVYGSDLITPITLSGARMESDSSVNFDGGFGFGPFGVVGTPALVGRITSMDHTQILENFTMGVSFPAALPAGNGHRYSVPLKLVTFPPTGQHNVGDPTPTYGPLLTAPVEVWFGAHAEANWFVVDSGAQQSLMSTSLAFRLGLDTNHDGSLDDEAVDFVQFQGASGTIDAPVLMIDSLRLKTKEGVDLVWTQCPVAVVDIDPAIPGVLGWDLITSGWLGEAFGEGVGYIRQANLDLRNSNTGVGTLYLDVDPSLDSISPGPTMWTAASGNWGNGGSWTGAEPNAGLIAIISNGGTATVSDGSRACLVLAMGYSSGGSGTVNMTGGGLNCGQVFVGREGSGAFAQSGGEHRINGDLYLGYFTGASGSYHLTDGNLFVGGIEYVGYDGDGAFRQSGGRHLVVGGLNVGYYSDSNGAYTLLGGQLIVPRVTVGPKGAMVFSGGTLQGSPDDSNLLASAINSGLIEIASGAWSIASIDCPDANVPTGMVRIDAGATLAVGEITQGSVYVSGTLVLDGSLLSRAAPLNVVTAGPALGSVPEPASLAILLIGAGVLARRRRAEPVA